MTNKIIKPFFAALFAGMVFSGAFAGEEAPATPVQPQPIEKTLRYVGSDFLEGTIEETLKADVAKLTPLLKLDGELIGSKFGIEKLRKGEADFGLLMIQDVDAVKEIKDKKWRALRFAHQVTYIVVSRANPVNEMTFSELTSMFARFSEKHVGLWEEFPASRGKLSGKIQMLAGTQMTNASATFFQSLVFPRSDFHKDVRFVKNDELVLRELSESYTGIAVVGTPLGSANAALKVIAVSKSTDSEKRGTPYAPIEVNIYNQDYPLSLPIYLVYPAEKRNAVLPILNVVFSDSFAGTLKKEALMPLPKNIRQGIQKNIDEHRNK